MSLFVTLSFLLLAAPLPDLVTPGFKKVVQEVAVENPNDFEDWQLVAAIFMGPSHVTVIEPGVPFRYSSKYGTRIYAIPFGTPIPEKSASGRLPREAFGAFTSVSIPVNLASSVSTLSPVEKTLTTIRITSVASDGIQLETVREQQFDAHNNSVGWLKLWGIPVSVATLGFAGLVFLRRRRLRRALG